MTTRLWVSVEGINGVGKTSAVRATAAAFDGRCAVLDELTDTTSDPLPAQVIAALCVAGDPFLRTGHPVAETLALLALQVRRTEQIDQRGLAHAEVILEDRGIDSIAVYQAAILCGQVPGSSQEMVAQRLLTTARQWRRLPDVTILLTGDPAVCARRFSDRIGCPLDTADVALIQQVDALYRTIASRHPARYVVVETADRTLEQTTTAVAQIVGTLLDRQVADAS